MGTLNITLRTVISIVIISAIIAFISLYSINSVLSREFIDNFVNEDSISETGNITEEDFDSLYETALFECQSKNEVVFSSEQFGEQIIISCNELSSFGREGFEELFSSKIEENVDDKIEENLRGKPKVIGSSLKWLLIISFMGCALIIFLAGKRSFLNLGIIGIVSGLPFFVLSLLEEYAEGKVQDFAMSSNIQLISDIGEIINAINSKMSTMYLSVFIIGIILVGIQIALVFMPKKEGNKNNLNNKKSNK